MPRSSSTCRSRRMVSPGDHELTGQVVHPDTRVAAQLRRDLQPALLGERGAQLIGHTAHCVTWSSPDHILRTWIYVECLVILWQAPPKLHAAPIGGRRAQPPAPQPPERRSREAHRPQHPHRRGRDRPARERGLLVQRRRLGRLHGDGRPERDRQARRVAPGRRSDALAEGGPGRDRQVPPGVPEGSGRRRIPGVDRPPDEVRRHRPVAHRAGRDRVRQQRDGAVHHRGRARRT